MSHLWSMVAAAFQRLEAQAGFETRPVQRAMAQFICERLESKSSGMVEAPTGVGKSLAALLPAVAYCLQEKKRIVISTYTNVLAEQYWRNDLPLALSLFPTAPSVALAMGRSRYACIDAIRSPKLKQAMPEMARYLQEWVGIAQEGTDTELSAFLRRKGIPAPLRRSAWETVATPHACRARMCPYYSLCFYYESRRRAAEARIVVTNHAFVLTDAIVRTSTNDEVSLLDDYDFLIVDEAHDLLDAAASALKFNLDQDLVDWLIAHAAALSNQLSDALTSEKPPLGFLNSVQKCGEGFAARCREAMGAVQLPPLPREGVAVRVAPEELARQPALASAYRADLHPLVAHVADTLRAEISALYRELEQIYRDHKGALNDGQRAAVEETLMQFRHGFMLTYQDLGRLKEPTEGVSWVEPAEKGWQACYEPLMLADWLRAQLWQRQPALLMSATLTVDGRFDFFKQQLGLETPHLLRLPPVFDYGRQCALYLPPLGTIPDPPQNAHAPGAGAYYQRLADEIGALLRLTHGRALVLFASRHEMHEVYRRLPTLPDVRVMLQGEGSNADLSKQFREDVHSVLFGVRSFWTGFDAPGETLMNLILTRIPFEVPTTPLQRARQAWFELQGVSAFAAWALPMAKQQMRQGFGRLIRRSNDTGIVAILDPRMRTKSYGREILNNLPQGIPIFDSIDALAHWLRQQVN